MIHRILSLVVAVVASVLGYLALWSGGTTLALAASSYNSGGRLDPGALALVALGVLLIAVAGMTVVFSSLGVIVVGAVHVLVGFVSILSPFEALRGPLPLPYQLINQVFDANSPVNFGFYASVPTGAGIAVGTVLLVAGIAARGRTARVSQFGRILSPILSVILGGVGVLIIVGQGAVVYASQLQRGSWRVDFGVVGAIVLATVLLAVAAFTLRWSSVGVFALGAIVAVFGLATLFQPNAVRAALTPVSQDLATGFGMWSGSGNFALLGIVLLAVGFAVRVRARRRLSATGAQASTTV